MMIHPQIIAPLAVSNLQRLVCSAFRNKCSDSPKAGRVRHDHQTGAGNSFIAKSIVSPEGRSAYRERPFQCHLNASCRTGLKAACADHDEIEKFNTVPRNPIDLASLCFGDQQQIQKEDRDGRSELGCTSYCPRTRKPYRLRQHLHSERCQAGDPVSGVDVEAVGRQRRVVCAQLRKGRGNILLHDGGTVAACSLTREENHPLRMISVRTRSAFVARCFFSGSCAECEGGGLQTPGPPPARFRDRSGVFRHRLSAQANEISFAALPRS